MDVAVSFMHGTAFKVRVTPKNAKAGITEVDQNPQNNLIQERAHRPSSQPGDSAAGWVLDGWRKQEHPCLAISKKG